MTMKRSILLAALAATACGADAGSTTTGDLPTPTNLGVEARGTDAHVTWTNSSSQVTGIEIERRGSGAFTQVAVVAAVVGDAYYHDGATEGGMTYDYRVRAVASGKKSTYTAEVKITLPREGTGGTGGGGVDAGAGGTGGRGGSGGAGGRDGGVPPAIPSFLRDIVPKLEAGCGSGDMNCHSRGQADGRSDPQYGPCQVAWLSTVNMPLGATYSGGPNAGKPTGCPNLSLYDRLIQIKSMLCVNKPARQNYVVKGNVAKSLLYQVLAGDPSMGRTCQDPMTGGPLARMPKAPYDKLNVWDAAAIKMLGDWITAGAPNN